MISRESIKFLDEIKSEDIAALRKETRLEATLTGLTMKRILIFFFITLFTSPAYFPSSYKAYGYAEA
jgi:hypothetical protein